MRFLGFVNMDTVFIFCGFPFPIERNFQSPVNLIGSLNLIAQSRAQPFLQKNLFTPPPWLLLPRRLSSDLQVTLLCFAKGIIFHSPLPVYIGIQMSEFLNRTVAKPRQEVAQTKVKRKPSSPIPCSPLHHHPITLPPHHPFNT